MGSRDFDALTTWCVLVGWMLIGCNPATDLPIAPAPLGAIALPADLKATQEIVPLRAPITVAGAFEITAQVDQFARSGPPLRLRVQTKVEAAPDGSLTITSLKITPARLTELLDLPNSGPVKAVRWPLTVLRHLHAQSTLASWLGTARSVGRCQAAGAGTTDLKVEERASPEGRVITYTTTPPDGSHRGEITGYLVLDAVNRVSKGTLKLRKWSRFDGE